MCVGGHAAFTRVTNGVRTGYCSAENQNVVVRNVVIHSGGAIDPPAIPARSYNYFRGLRALQAEQGGLHGLAQPASICSASVHPATSRSPIACQKPASRFLASSSGPCGPNPTKNACSDSLPSPYRPADCFTPRHAVK
jgi:hypothetical protein